MILNDRQRTILLDLYHSENKILSANFFAQKLDVSIRTIQYDMAEIKRILEIVDFVDLISISSKGSKLVIHDEEKFQKWLTDIDESLRIQSLSSRKERVNRIISFLLGTKSSITVQHMSDRLFVSKSTFMIDLKHVETILKKYNIEMINKRNIGLSIRGDEMNIRKCIMQEKIDTSFTYNEFMTIGQMSENMPKIGDILVNTLNEYKYRISNIALQNLIVHVDIIIHRIKNGFVIEDISDEDLDEDFAKEYAIAKRVFNECNRIFHLPMTNSEINRLAIYLKGKSDYQESTYITREIDEFVLDGLKYIKQKFGIDFIDNVQLRISLSLHIIPLIIRLKYEMQLKNDLLDFVRKSYQLAFDMAYSFSYLMQKKYGYKLIEDEIAYFAIYFNSAIEIYQKNDGMNKILVISSLKRSETLLLTERIKFRLSNSISELDIVNAYDLDDVSINQYNVICTTEKNKYYSNGLALLISQFPTEEDCHNIMMAMDGFSGKEDILSLFKESMMFIGNAKNKDQVIEELCHKIINKESEDEKLYQEVLLREAMGGTYYGNYVAMPHPMHPITRKTQVAIALLKNDLVWDEYENRVRIVLLVSIEKDNPRAFKLWSYLSEFITNEDFVNAVLSELSYSNFIKQLSNALDAMNW